MQASGPGAQDKLGCNRGLVVLAATRIVKHILAGSTEVVLVQAREWRWQQPSGI